VDSYDQWKQGASRQASKAQKKIIKVIDKLSSVIYNVIPVSFSVKNNIASVRLSTVSACQWRTGNLQIWPT
jgi:hypothetical protein